MLISNNTHEKRFLLISGKDIFSPEADSSPAPSSAEPQNITLGTKQTSRTSSFEIENLLKTAEQVCFMLYYFHKQNIMIVKSCYRREMNFENEIKLL